MRRTRLAFACTALLAARDAAASCGTIVLPAGVGLSEPYVVTTLDPLLVTSAPDVNVSALLFRPLLLVRDDHSINWDDSLAAAVAVDRTDTVFTVTLKPWLWSDGVPVTASDVLYTWSLVRALGAAWVNYGNGGVPMLIRDVAAPDARTVVFRTTRPVNPQWFEDDGLPLFAPLPAHAWRRVTPARQRDLQDRPDFYTAVDGPFRVETFRPGRDATFVPNGRYGGHHPDYRRLVVVFTAGTDPLEALRTHGIDMATLPPELTEAASHLPGVDAVRIGEAPEFPSLIPNLANDRDPFFRDERVRRAMAMAIDQRRIVATVYHGDAVEQHGFVPTAWRTLVPPDLPSLPYDPDRAQHLLDEAGWPVGPDGIRRRDGVALSFSADVIAVGAADTMTMQLVQDDLRQVGIRMRLRQLQFTPLMSEVVGPPAAWDAVLIPQASSTFPDGAVAFTEGSENDYGHYDDPRLTRLLDAATGSPGTAALFAAERAIAAAQPMIFLPAPIETVLARRGISGIDRFLDTVGNWLPEYLTIDPAPDCAPHA